MTEYFPPFLGPQTFGSHLASKVFIVAYTFMDPAFERITHVTKTRDLPLLLALSARGKSPWSAYEHKVHILEVCNTRLSGPLRDGVSIWRAIAEAAGWTNCEYRKPAQPAISDWDHVLECPEGMSALKDANGYPFWLSIQADSSGNIFGKLRPRSASGLSLT